MIPEYEMKEREMLERALSRLREVEGIEAGARREGQAKLA